jgi:HD-like signal output (HDOD) protein
VADPAESAEHRLDEMVAAIAAKGDFPAAARMIQRLHEAVRRENCNALDVAQVILNDPGLSSKVLRVVNSSFYRPRGEPVSTITRAVFLLGFEAIRDLTTGLLLIDEIARAAGGRTTIRDVLYRCLLTGSVSRSLSTTVGYANPEEAYLLGLFANWGQLCLAAYFPERYERAVRTAREIDDSLERALAAEFGLPSSDLATAMLARWNFPSSYADYFRHPHPKGDRPVTTSGQRLVALVDVASEYAACAVDADPAVRAQAVAKLRAAETMFGRRLEDIVAAAERGAEDAREHVPLLRVAGGHAAPTPHGVRAPFEIPGDVTAAPREGHGAGEGAAPLQVAPPAEAPATAAIEILAEITRAILAQDDINGTLAMILEGIARTGKFDVAFLALLNGKKDQLLGRLGYGDGVTEYLSALRVPVHAHSGVLAETMLARQPRIVPQGTSAMLVPPGTPAPKMPAASFIAHPLIVRGKVVGVMVAARGPGKPPVGGSDLPVVQLFCNQAGLALDRAVS